MQSPNRQLSPVISRYARFGEWAANFGLFLLVAVVFYVLYQAVTGTLDPNQGFELDLDINEFVATLSGAKLWVIALITSVQDILGFVLFLTVRALFIGIRTMGVFVQSTARRLRIIGWTVFAMAPASILAELISTGLTRWWADHSELTVHISISDTDVYAVVIGLLLVVVSQIMLEAIRIYDENGAFV